MSNMNLSRCIKELYDISLEEIGKKVVLSAVLFETGVAALLNSESRKLQVLIEICNKDSYSCSTYEV